MYLSSVPPESSTSSVIGVRYSPRKLASASGPIASANAERLDAFRHGTRHVAGNQNARRRNVGVRSCCPCHFQFRLDCSYGCNDYVSILATARSVVGIASARLCPCNHYRHIRSLVCNGRTSLVG